MKNFIRSGICTVLMLLIISGLPAGAQEDTLTIPLLEMLAHVPDTTVARSDLAYEDQQAIVTAYTPAEMPADFADFRTVLDGLDEDSEVEPKEIWWRVFNFTDSSIAATYVMEAETMPDVMGFDYFDIDRELYYGDPPQRTYQFEGRFNVEAVRAALSARGYEQHDESGAEIWCVEEGCDGGERINLTSRNLANPFGGELGRELPILVSDERLIASVSQPVMEQHVQAMNKEAPSLADAPDYRAAVQALTAGGTLVQARFFGSEVLPLINQITADSLANIPQTQAEALVQDMLEDFETLPAYSLMGFGDVVTDTEQIGRVVLVYGDADSAKTAVDLIPRRIAQYQMLSADRSMNETLESYGVTNVQAEVTKGEADSVYVVTLSFPTAKATPEEIAAMWLRNPDPPAATLPGYVYRLLVTMVMRNDSGWLTTTTREELEALAGG